MQIVEKGIYTTLESFLVEQFGAKLAAQTLEQLTEDLKFIYDNNLPIEVKNLGNITLSDLAAFLLKCEDGLVVRTVESHMHARLVRGVQSYDFSPNALVNDNGIAQLAIIQPKIIDI